MIKVGHDKNGVPRLENHHWHNCRIAYLHPDAVEAARPDRGRPRKFSEEKTNMAEQTTLPELSEEEPPKITQPFHQAGADLFQNSAAGAEFGNNIEIEPFLPPERSATSTVPFPKQKQFSPQPRTSRQTLSDQPEPTSTPGPKPVTREPLPREASGGLAPPVTKGAPQTGPPPSPFNSTPAPSA